MYSWAAVAYMIVLTTIPLAYLLAGHIFKFATSLGFLQIPSRPRKKVATRRFAVLQFYFTLPALLALIEAGILPRLFGTFAALCVAMFFFSYSLIYFRVIHLKSGWSDSALTSRARIENMSLSESANIFRHYIESGDYWISVTGLLRRGAPSEGTVQAALYILRNNQMQLIENKDRTEELMATFHVMALRARKSHDSVRTLGIELQRELKALG